jgi:hypothetical protein
MRDLNIAFAVALLIGKIDFQEDFYKSIQRKPRPGKCSGRYSPTSIELRRWGQQSHAVDAFYPNPRPDWRSDYCDTNSACVDADCLMSRAL